MRHTPTVKQLRAFAAVYRSGKVATAASELALTQSAVSALIRQLEAKLATPLFDRTARALHRTAAADGLIATAERLLAELDGLAEDVQRLDGQPGGKIRIAVTPALAQTLMPQALRRFGEAHPDVRVQLDDGAPDQFINAIVTERVDFGIGIIDQPHPELSTELFLRDYLCLVCDRRNPLAATPGSLPWRELADQPLILVKPGYGVRRSIDRAAAKAGADLQIAHEVSLFATAIAMVVEGLGAAILPSSMAGQVAKQHGLVTRKLVSPMVPRHISVVTRKGRSLPAAARQLLAMLGKT
jgi:LysR family carnitine catabolism transcriptional activator